MALRQAQDERDMAEHVGADVLGGQRWQPIQKDRRGRTTDDLLQTEVIRKTQPKLALLHYSLTYFSSGHLRPTK